MFDKDRLESALVLYKKNFEKHWKHEQYKWKAVKHFQDHWDINASNLAEMLKESLSKTYNLLSSMNNYPLVMIVSLAEAAPEEVRKMFVKLFDEDEDIYTRIHDFKMQADELLAEYGKGEKQHYQHENAITTYLWLRYPNRYYIYKFSEVKKVSDALSSDYHFAKGRYKENIQNFLRFYDEICEFIQHNEEVKSLLADHLTDECYPDKYFRTLTFDIGFYISREYEDDKEDLSNKDNTVNEASISDYNLPAIWKISHGLQVIPEDQRDLFESKKIVAVDGTTRAKAMSKTTQGEDFVSGIRKGDYFYLCYGNRVRLLGRFTDDKAAPNAERGGSWYERSYEKIADSQNDTPYTGEAKWWAPNNNSTCIKVKEEEKPQFEELILKPYFHMSIQELYNAASDESQSDRKMALPRYTKDDFLSEVFLSGEQYDRLAGVLLHKQNIILQGAPGVGKTFCAKRLAYSLMGEQDDDRIEFVQFHQNYSYEDFMMGYRPTEQGFALKKGIFYRFCQKAEGQPDKKFFFIIDEINRGNLSKIFGELLMLIEKDYRGHKITLAYNGLPFSVPKNLYIIGMMNTADRSLAMIDYALRRRFSFFEIEPGFETQGFRDYQGALANSTFDNLIAKIIELNEEIRKDSSLGRGFCIGHSYFCGYTKEDCTNEWMQSVVDYDILPMLTEYWFDDEDKVERWQGILHGVFA